MNAKELICPVSTERVNETVVRCNALLTLLTVSTAVYFRSPVILALLVTDFYVRAFTNIRTSPLTYISKTLVNWLKLSLRPIDKAPKIFAARLGFLMSFAILVMLLAGASAAALVTASILGVFAMLELTIGFCAGCYIYTYIILPATRNT